MSGTFLTNPAGSGSGGSSTSYTDATSADGINEVSVAGTVTTGKAWVRITNTGITVATVNGGTLQPGQSVEFTAYQDPASLEFVRVGQIAYDPNGGTLSIATKD